MEGDAGPTRTCTGCRAKRRQDELIRVVHRPDGSVGIGRGSGRGAYVCRDGRCIERAWKSGALRRTLQFEGPLPEELRAQLYERGEEGKDGKAEGA